MDEKARLKITKELKELEADYRRYIDPDVMVKLKASVLDDVWEIHSGVIRPDGAAFIVGRTFEALKLYGKALYTLKRFEELEGKLAALTESD